MSLSDDILMPHPPEVFAAKIQKRLAEVEKVFPGLIEKTRRWMNGPDFGAMFVSAKRRAPKAVRMGVVPMSMKVAVARIAGLSGIVGSGSDYAADHYDLIEWLADLLWKEAEMPSKYWELNTHTYHGK